VATPDLGRAIRWELVNQANKRQPEQVSRFVDRLRLFHEHRASGLVDWVQWLSGSANGSGSAAQPEESWRGLLVDELSKDAYNAMTELKAVLEGNSWEEAARLIAAFRPLAIRGVAPALGDEQLLCSIPVTVAGILDKYPQVKDVLAQKFAV